jgi:F-type H+-transporting ATPase subunit gamma
MAGGKERVLRRRINSVQSTKKITRAMELIAATRVAKAQQRANQARPYAEQITGVIQDLAEGGADVDHPLLRKAETRKVAFVVITSDRGLAGAYNSSVIRAAEREVMALRAEGGDYSLILIGKKAESYFRFRGYRIDAAFHGMSDTPRFEDARPSPTPCRELFISGEVDQVELVYTRFVSVGSQQVVVRRFLPLQTRERESGGEALAGFEFEPSPEGVLAALLPRYVEARLFAALLDAAASEHANRQRAMKAATDNAEELIIKLAGAMNRARQDAITTEIMEIVGGAEALRADKGDPEDLLLDHLFPSHLFPDTASSTSRPADRPGDTHDRHRDPRHRPEGRPHRRHRRPGRRRRVPGRRPARDQHRAVDDHHRRRQGHRGAGRGRPADRQQPRAGHLPQAHRRPHPGHPGAQHRRGHHRAGGRRCSVTCST